MGNGVVMPAAASAATSGAGTPAAAKETARMAGGAVACAAGLGLARRLPRGVDGRSVGRADNKTSGLEEWPHLKATTSVETSSLVIGVRPARRVGMGAQRHAVAYSGRRK